MARCYSYAIVKIAPDPVRDEALNCAMVVFREGRLDIHVTPNPDRLRTIAPAIHAHGLDELCASLQALDNPALATEERIELLRRLPGVVVSDPGILLAESDEQLQIRVAEIVARMLTTVRASTALVDVAVPKVTTPLTRELREIFKREKLLARGNEVIEHKIVQNIPVSSDGSLRVAFVAKNRRMHVTETADLRTEGDLPFAKLKDIAVAAVTLDEAQRHFGKGTQRYFIYAAKAAAERQARGFLQAAEHHADHVFNFASKSDRGSYFDFMFDALRGDLAGKARVSGHTPTDPKPGRRR